MFVLQRDNYLAADAALVLLGGRPPERAEWLALVRQAGFVAAADGGAAAALQQGRTPDLLAGDFDSLPAEQLADCRRGDCCRIFQLPEHKDMTDGEFLLGHLFAEGWRRLLILGALGGRPEMSLANLLTAAPLALKGAEICLLHDGGLVFVLAAEQEERRLALRGFAGCTVSLTALGGGCGRVELQGFEYPLAGGLAAYTSLGISNVAQSDQAFISLREGCLLVFINF